ncbi:MAG: quinolinate synthase NadA [Lachnospiraceae bacterium]|nr:quinolinate synthase NadA [Lachnospiraceae bacterium]
MRNIMKEQIKRLKEEKDVVILAHYYVDGQVQEIADMVGDSYFLAKKATEVSQQNILFCGVSFMGESAKILNPDKRVIMADEFADCPMAHMVDIRRIEEVREHYPDVAVVCYVNSTAEIKAYSDVCVTSSNALRVVKALPNKHIFFIPDNNLGRYIATLVPEKEFIFNDGFCHVHTSIHKENVEEAKKLHPDAPILTHPECTADVLEISDFIGSTSEILDYATKSSAKEFIICTEMGIFYELREKNPDKKFYSVGHRQFCPNMKKITLEKVLHALETLEPEVTLPEELRVKANAPLVKMLELAK